jgi:hypothetical protein
MRGLVCVKCQKFFRIKKNSVTVEEGMPHDGVWGPYKLWKAGLYECPDCGIEVVAGFAQHNFSEHYLPTYPEDRAKNPPLVTVNDCGGCKP